MPTNYGEPPQWRLQADRTIVCFSSPRIIYIHCVAVLAFIGIVVLFPLFVIKKVVKISQQNLWEEEAEITKCDFFFCDEHQGMCLTACQY